VATPSTITRRSVGSTRTTRPSRPRSLPEITRTVSSFLMSTPGIVTAPPSARPLALQDLRCEGDDLHIALVPGPPGHRPEDPRPPRVPRIGRQQDHRVVVEPDVRAVGPPTLL